MICTLSLSLSVSRGTVDLKFRGAARRAVEDAVCAAHLGARRLKDVINWDLDLGWI